jgi:hypothetical protein
MQAIGDFWQHAALAAVAGISIIVTVRTAFEVV